MGLKALAVVVCFAIHLHGKGSFGDILGCTPLTANRSVWLSNNRPTGNISSPTTFPSNQSVYCSWIIFVPKGNRIKVHFSSFNLKNSTNCSSSAVELVEKEGLISISLGRHCGGHVPDDVLSTYSFLSVIYTATNGSTPQHPGFHASISLAPAETCSPDHDPDANNNIVISASNGRLYTPLFPLNYRVNMKCRWTVTVPKGHRIKLIFQAFNLGPTDQETCDKLDNVVVQDSFNKNDPAYGPFCGNVPPSPIYSVGPSMVVTFVSDEETVFQGFEAKFDAVPGGVCTSNSSVVQLNLTRNSTGRVSSPDYPLLYSPVSACYWRFQAPEGYRIKLHFTTVNIEGNCQQDEKAGNWIRVDDFFTTDFNSVASFWGRFCGGVQPPVIYSTSNELQVFFISNYTSKADAKSTTQRQTSINTGFYATYGVTPQGYTSRCRTDRNMDKAIAVQGLTGSVVSPGYPYSYPIISCTWEIKVPDGYILEVNIKDFEMDCSGGSKMLVGKDSFCGTNKPFGVLTSESDMKIQMIAREARDNRGFRATFSMTKQELAVSSIVPWIVIPIVAVAVAVTMFIMWRKRTRDGLDRKSSFTGSIINRTRAQSSVSQA